MLEVGWLGRQEALDAWFRETVPNITPEALASVSVRLRGGLALVPAGISVRDGGNVFHPVAIEMLRLGGGLVSAQSATIRA